MAEIGRQVAAGDMDTLKEVAHRFKTSCGIVGASEMAEACLGLETAAKNNQPEIAQKIYDQLVECERRSREILEIELKDAS